MKVVLVDVEFAVLQMDYQAIIWYKVTGMSNLGCRGMVEFCTVTFLSVNSFAECVGCPQSPRPQSPDAGVC